MICYRLTSPKLTAVIGFHKKIYRYIRSHNIAKDYRVNQRIKVPEVRLVDEEGNQLGVKSVRDAITLAEERGLDLVEVAPSAKPPVCRIMDYGRFRYEINRKERNARKVQKSKSNTEIREVRLKTRISANDRTSMSNQVKRLLSEGAKVKVSVMFRGREITHPEVGMEVLKLVAKDLGEDALVEKPPAFEGRFLTMVLVPNRQKPNQTSQSTASLVTN